MFIEHAVQENIYAGPAMTRRATYMYGSLLERGPYGQVGCGLGQTPSTGEVAVIVPTLDIRSTGEKHTIDGVEIEFQMAPGTEAPAEMHFYFPRFRALCIAENATHNLHNLLTLRGALVRDPRAWAGYLTEAIDTFADLDSNYRLTLRNGVLVYRKIAADPTSADVTMVAATKARLLAAVMGDVSSPGLELSGDQAALQALLGVLDRPDPAFNIVTP